MQPFDFVVYFYLFIYFCISIIWIAVMYEMYEIDALGKNQWQNKQRGCSGGGCNMVWWRQKQAAIAAASAMVVAIAIL